MNSTRITLPRFALILAVSFSGVFAAHAANPSIFSIGQVPNPNGIVATPAVFLVSSQDQPQDQFGPPAKYHSNIYSLNALGNVIGGGPFITISDANMDLQEVYLAAAPGVGGGWTSFDIYACRGNRVYHIPAAGGAVDGTAPFATLPGARDRQHCGITFDRTGDFGFAMIVTTEGDTGPLPPSTGHGGRVFKITSGGAVTQLVELPFQQAPPTANVTEGPQVVPAGFFGTNGVTAELLVTQEQNLVLGKIFHITNTGVVGEAAAAIPDPESTHLVPPGVCDYSTTGGGFFTTDFFNSAIIKYPASDFAGLGGNVLLPAEFTTPGNNIAMINKTTGTVTPFDAIAGNPPIIHEGSIFVECGPATMPIIKHSTDPNTAATNADFLFGLYPRANNSFGNPPTGVPFNYVVNTNGTVSAACNAVPFYTGPDLRGTCIVTPPENNLPIDLSNGPFNAAVCEVAHIADWTFDDWTVTFTPVLPGQFASAPFHPTGETLDPEIFCINLTIVQGTTEVDLNVFDTPPTQPSGTGRFTGGGSFFPTQGDLPSNKNTRITHGFELRCDPSDPRQNLEVNWPGDGKGKKAENNFHMDDVVLAHCIDDSNIDPQHPIAPIDTYEAIGTGKFNGDDGATAHWVFTDDGEPGVNDEVWIEIWDNTGTVVLRIGGRAMDSKTTLLTPAQLEALVKAPGTDTGSQIDKGNQQAHK